MRTGIRLLPQATTRPCRSSYAEALTLRRMMPLHPAGASEDAGGYDQSSLRATDREIAAAHRGDFTLVRQYLRANCS